MIPEIKDQHLWHASFFDVLFAGGVNSKYVMLGDLPCKTLMGLYWKYVGTLGLSTMVENKSIEMALFSWNGYPHPVKKQQKHLQQIQDKISFNWSYFDSFCPKPLPNKNISKPPPSKGSSIHLQNFGPVWENVPSMYNLQKIWSLAHSIHVRYI